MDQSIKSYISIASSLPREVQLQLFAYSFKEISLGDATVSQFINVFKMFNSRPIMIITFSLPGEVSFCLSLTNKSHVHFSLSLSCINYNPGLLQELLSLKIKKVLVENRVLSRVMTKEPALIEFINHLLSIVDAPIIQLDLPVFPFMDVQPWFKKVTHIKYNDSFTDFSSIKNEFTSLINLTVQLRESIISDDWFCLIPDSKANRKLTLEFMYLNPISSELSKYIELCGGEDRVEIKMTDACVQLNEETSDFYSSLKGMHTLHLHHCSPPYDYGFGMYTAPLEYDLLPEIKNVRKLIIEAADLSDTVLENESICDLTLSTSDCRNVDLSNLKRLTTLKFGVMHHGCGEKDICFNTETFESIPNYVAKISIDSPISTKGDTNDDCEDSFLLKLLPLPKYLQEFECSTTDLHKFDFSKCEHLRSLSLTDTNAVEEDNELWRKLPCHINNFKLQFSITSTNRNLQPTYNNRSKKQFGVTIFDEFKNRDMEFSIGRHLTKNLVCINTELPRTAKSMLESGMLGRMDHSRINLSSESNIKLFIDEVSFPIVLCEDEMLGSVYSFKSKNHYKKVGLIEGLAVLQPEENGDSRFLNWEYTSDYY